MRDPHPCAEGELFGTDLVQELRTSSFSGLILVRSANTEAEQDYLDAGADGALCKSMKWASAIAEVKDCYRWKFPAT